MVFFDGFEGPIPSVFLTAGFDGPVLTFLAGDCPSEAFTAAESPLKSFPQADIDVDIFGISRRLRLLSFLTCSRGLLFISQAHCWLCIELLLSSPP